MQSITVQAVPCSVRSVEVQASSHSASCVSTDSVEVRASFTVLCCVSFVLLWKPMCVVVTAMVMLSVPSNETYDTLQYGWNGQAHVMLQYRLVSCCIGDWKVMT